MEGRNTTPRGWHHHLPLKTQGVLDSFSWRSCWRMKAWVEVAPSAGLRLTNASSEAPRCLRGVSWCPSRTLRLKPIYTMDETSGHPRVSDIDFEMRRKTTVEVAVVECSCFSWWWLSWSNEVDRPHSPGYYYPTATTNICSVTWPDGDWLVIGLARRGPKCLDFIRWPLKLIYLKLLLQ